MIKFYDTCALLSELQAAFKSEQKFFISQITIQELEKIKTSANKDGDIKMRARKLIRLLNENEDKYQVKPYHAPHLFSKKYPLLSDNNDSKIIKTALDVAKKNDIIFITEDLCCKHIAKACGLQVEYLTTEDKSEYTGFIKVIMNQEELINFYNSFSQELTYNKYNLLPNQYIIITEPTGEVLINISGLDVLIRKFHLPLLIQIILVR